MSSENRSHVFQLQKHAEDYVKFRPTSPPQLIKFILDYVDDGKPFAARKLAIDVACGSGQATYKLAPFFERVFGYDVSEAQISVAQQSNNTSNVTFDVSPCENLVQPDGSTTLVTVSQAIHWFDNLQGFYSEVQRVLMPGGALAIFAYAAPQICDPRETNTPALQSVFNKYYKGIFGPYWSLNRDEVDSGYTNLPAPAGLTDFKRWSFATSTPATVEDVVKYVSTWSAAVKYNIDNPGNTVLEDFRKELSHANANSDDVTIQFKFNVLLYRKPKK